MYEIRNKQKGPVQLIVRSFSPRRENAKEFTVLNIYGNNIFFVEDERIIDKYLKYNKKHGLLDYKLIDKERFEKTYDPNNPQMKYVRGYKVKSEEN